MNLEEITPEMLASWKAMKTEICLFIRKNEEFWVVPEYTDKDRVEISIDDFVKQRAAIAMVLNAFPESKVATVIRPKKLEP